jgi:hypothetical protein
LGWTGSEGLSQGLSVTGFVNFYPHGAVTATTIPPCYWSTGINPVTGVAFKAGDCYPGSPFWGPYSVFPNLYPGVYTFDLSIGYQTGARPTNEYLRNLNIQFTVNDLLNKAPPFNYEAGSAAGRGLAVASIISPQQPYISFSVTKTW